MLSVVATRPSAAAEREGRRHRVVDAAEGADGRRCVDEDAPGANAVRERLDHALVRCVDRGGVAEPSVLGDRLGRRDGVVDGGRAHEPEDGHQLLGRERVLEQRLEVARQRASRTLSSSTRLESGDRAEVQARLADRLHGAPRRRRTRQRSGPPPRPRRAAARRAVGARSPSRPCTGSSMMAVCSAGQITDGRTSWRSACRRGHPDVGAAVHVDGRVAGADAQAWLPRRIRGGDGCSALRWSR